MKFHQTQYIYLAWAAHSDEIFYFFSNKYIFDTHWRVKSPVMSVLSVVLLINHGFGTVEARWWQKQSKTDFSIRVCRVNS